MRVFISVDMEGVAGVATLSRTAAGYYLSSIAAQQSAALAFRR